MRKEFIAGCESEQDAINTCPWACKCIEVEGGWMCFESWSDVEIWENQEKPEKLSDCKNQSELADWMKDLEEEYAKPNESWGETADRIEEDEPDVAKTFRRAETLWFNLDN